MSYLPHIAWRHPDWYPLILLSLATFRCYRLVAADSITARWRAWLTGYYDSGVQVGSMAPPWRRPSHGEHFRARPSRVGLRTFIACRWCTGWWIGCAWFAAWLWQPSATLTASIPFTVSAVAALVSKNLDAE